MHDIADLQARSGEMLDSARRLAALGVAADATVAAITLDDLAATVAALADCCDAMATAVVPPAPVCSERIGLAARDWPTASGCSRERLVALLAALDDAATDIRIAAASCRRARDAVPPILAT